MNDKPTRAELISEYEEIGNCYRHDDTLAFNMGSFLLPVALGAVAVAASQPKLRLILGVGSISVCAYWLAVVARVSWYSSLRLIRAAQIEEALGFDHHLSIQRQHGSGLPLPSDVWSKTRRPERVILWVGSRVPARRVHVMLLVGLLLAWCLLFFSPANEENAAPPETIKTTTIFGGVNRH